ncbi:MULTISPECIES: leucyl/phenylalanyl-tRNA--protein transferase [Serratia]|uniref:leucyl/phenylalanyl-tRNA--protein transferase n=1 Tax=Serratia TaxID=613 RepID=UPI00062CAEF2|nr:MULTISPECIES: leucyl/phenylalanyl-tRNA--protein transferase [Serratia]KKZ19580.1 leucyl/phenylalanyl-tRNA--protein transferase [Serratia marcescens]MDI3198899.1 leucyl/phenylalanyl-tRNA--protein transferase [Serratia ureilytica]UUW19949.1 leucyl/phenylalanyl-tRNA--protein transferase [Serratia ureilytica]
MRIVKLSPQSLAFPSPEGALRDPNGLLAIGGDLTAPRLLAAYERGIFPWYSPGEAILWWSPDPRAVLLPAEFNLNRSLKRFLRHDPFRITLNHDFAAVIAACAHRPDEGTWIGPEVQRAYQHLHRLGYAHSVEVWQDDQLVGGMYGVAQGALFCGESMFSRVTNASKCALMAFCRHFAAYGGELIDCQVLNAHTARLGAREIPRRQFLQQLSTLQRRPLAPACWEPQVISPQPVEPPYPVN